jgi:hypothetical protein
MPLWRWSVGAPFLYDANDPDKLLLGINDAGEPGDLLRNHQGRALVGDPRNNVHLIISQLHLAFLKFHNRVVDWVREQGTPEGDVFDEARCPRAGTTSGSPPTSSCRSLPGMTSWPMSRRTAEGTSTAMASP